MQLHSKITCVVLLALAFASALAVDVSARQLRGSGYCNGNEAAGVRYKCLGDRKYAICLGEQYLGKGKCGRHTECQCGNTFNQHSPCGNDSALALCLSDATDELCAGNDDGHISFVCEDDDIFVTCDGDDAVNRGLVPPGTECQCSGQTCSPPWGDDNSESKCKVWKEGDKCRKEK